VNLRRRGEALSSHYGVVSRETLFQSPVAQSSTRPTTWPAWNRRKSIPAP
jgi:hypothetical protein